MRKRTRLTLGLALTAALALGTGGTALAEHAADTASCPGLGISDHAMWGEMPETIKGLKAVVAAADENLGAFMSRFAKAHAGTHIPGCEAAAGEIIGALLTP